MRVSKAHRKCPGHRAGRFRLWGKSSRLEIKTSQNLKGRTGDGHKMRPGLEEWFERETADLRDKTVPYAVRLMKWRRLVQAQEGVVRVQKDGSIATPIDPEDIKDANEYLERLKQIRITL